MPLRLTYRTRAATALEVDSLAPDRLAGLSAAQVATLPAWHGKRQVPLGEFFDVAGSIDDGRLELVGELSNVHGVGRGMAAGELHVTGNVGRHAGAEMRGGRLQIDGSADDWLGVEMRGGTIVVRGNAGRCAGGAYVGSSRGMRGGSIVIHGDAGAEVGHTMRRGLIAVGGLVGDFAAINMIAGTIVAAQGCGARPAAGMRRGSLIVLAGRPELLPMFRPSGRCQPTYLRLYEEFLRGLGFTPENWPTAFEQFAGDHLNGGRGEILIGCAS
ncbi:MAG: formylmethanofuran dehydrogenase subunit C [Planctomycetes bacterium]|nr:formylmethanofuran dehydrogenase subunit C [Planctomycetota bacterium]